jgi:hypothetical protein
MFNSSRLSNPSAVNLEQVKASLSYRPPLSQSQALLSRLDLHSFLLSKFEPPIRIIFKTSCSISKTLLVPFFYLKLGILSSRCRGRRSTALYLASRPRGDKLETSPLATTRVAQYSQVHNPISTRSSSCLRLLYDRRC